MVHRLESKAGKELYTLRKQTVEPVFGIIKEVMGFRRFMMLKLSVISYWGKRSEVRENFFWG